MEPNNYQRVWLKCIALVFFLALIFQGSRGLWEPDEGRYVRCASEMVKSNNWLIPKINGIPHFSKPPLTYWLVASGLHIFGMNEWGARVFHGIVFALTAIIVGILGSRMWDQKTGLLACLIYSTTVTPFIAGNIVTTDTILVFWETLAVLCFWTSVRSRDDIFKSSLWLLLMWFLFGIAFLTKGPAVLLPLAAIIPYFILRKESKPSPLMVTIGGILIFMVVASSWYLLVTMHFKGLLSYWVKKEFIARVFTAEYKKNPGLSGLLKSYLPPLTLGALPWSWYWIPLARKYNPQILTRRWWRQLRQRPVALFLFLWFGIPFFLLCLADSRLPLYILPLFAPLTLVTARGLVRTYPERVIDFISFRKKAGIVIIGITIFLVSMKLIAAYIPVKRDSRTLWKRISPVIQQKLGNEPY
ncbi:MAG TPA: glycosyltransferase family 39 protein, partial [Thermodesulfobacteriota bacterium]|nr:glycosyltransferase family 39 protein [Thermodesulfobacteriota bacterium]